MSYSSIGMLRDNIPILLLLLFLLFYDMHYKMNTKCIYYIEEKLNRHTYVLDSNNTQEVNHFPKRTISYIYLNYGYTLVTYRKMCK